MDIKIDRNGLMLNKGKFELTSGKGEALAQRLTIRLRTHYQSWFLDYLMGIDYFKRVFEKGIPKSSIDSVFQFEINKDPRVARIIYFSSKIMGNTYYLDFKVKAVDGAVTDLIQISSNPSNIDVGV